MNKKDKLITLASGKQYVIADQCQYNNETYYLGCEVVNGDTTEMFKIFNIHNIDSKQIIKTITDDAIIKEVCKILDKQ